MLLTLPILFMLSSLAELLWDRVSNWNNKKDNNELNTYYQIRIVGSIEPYGFYSIYVSLLSHICFTSVSLLSHSCLPAVHFSLSVVCFFLPAVYFCLPAVSLRVNFVSLLSRFWFSAVFFTNLYSVSLLFYFCISSVSLLSLC